MPSTAEQVARYLDEDLALKEILARGILNLRRAARWLIAQEGWDATEEAVVSALRRFAGSSEAEQVERAREALAGADIGLRSDLQQLTLARGPRLHRRLRKAHGAVGDEQTMIVLVGNSEVRLVVDGRSVEAVSAELGTEPGDAELALVQLTFPRAGPATGMGVAIVLNALVQDGIEMREVFTCAPEFWIAVDAGDARRAFEAVSRLAGVA